MADVDPPLPYRADDAASRRYEFPGPLRGSLPIGTIADEGGWNPKAAVDFDLTSETGALVLARSGRVHAAGDASIPAGMPWFGIDIARRIEYFEAGGEAYAVVLDGLGGIHLGGPAGDLRERWEDFVVPNMVYFAAVVDTDGEGRDVYVGLDAANDFGVVLAPDESDIGLLLVDGLGGVHTANVPAEYTSLAPAYLWQSDAWLDTVVSVLLFHPAP
jgi:hypothetical protein